MGTTVVKWLTFGVLLSLFPIVVAAITDKALGDTQASTHYFMRGDLYVIACVLCMTSAGELSDRNFNGELHQSLRTFVLFIVIFNGLVDSVLYGCVYGLDKLGNQSDRLKALADASKLFFLASAASSTAAIAWSKVQE